MPKIIISYRRVDSQDVTMRIRDRLAMRYGTKSVFTDIDSIPIGNDFLKHINDELATCDVLLAVVGPRWLQGGQDPSKSIREENDYVRIEVEGALKRDIPVVPVVVGGARMPVPSDLPESMRAFAYRNAAMVDSGVNFQNDMDRLVRSLDDHFAANLPDDAPDPVDDELDGISDDTRETVINATRARKSWFRRVGSLRLTILVAIFAFAAMAVAFKWLSEGAPVLGFGDKSSDAKLAAAICAKPEAETALYSCGHSDSDYVVVNVHSDDSDHGLVIRDHAASSGIQVGLIPPNGTDISVGACESGWCAVRCKQFSGWARESYLSKRAPAVRQVKGINPNDPDGLIVRAGPDRTCRSTGALRTNGRDMILHGCEMSSVDQAMWCRITINRISGWIPAENLGQ